MFTPHFFDQFVESIDACPWGTSAGRSAVWYVTPTRQMRRKSLYTVEERHRRDTSPWTMVQGVLAPVQFAAFLISLYLVLTYLATGHGLTAATASVVVKTFLLYTIMVTGAIWERVVFGRYLFAPAFFWEDVFSILVLTLHTAYLAAYFTGSLDPHSLLLLALAAYASYVVNAAQFLLKLRAARLDQDKTRRPHGLMELAQ